MRTIRAVISFLVVVLCVSTANADLSNGGFENVDLIGTGWITTGTVAAVDWELPRDPYVAQPVPTSGFWEPREGAYFASLWSTGWGGDAATLSQTFTVPAGYVLSFDYFYDFGDEAPYYDPARIWVVDSFFDVFFEMTINDLVKGTELADDENIGWTHVMVPFPMAGQYTLGFRIMDYDGTFESILGVDHVSVVPVPSALLLGVLGLGYASSLLGRSRRGGIS